MASRNRRFYDPSGNRTNLVIGGNSYPYAISGASNRLASVAGPTQTTYTYDGVGSLKQTNLASFSYDARHRLTGVSLGSSSIAYQVNALGQRVQKIPGSGSATVFHYDRDGKLIAESDAAGNIKTSYVYLNELPVGVIAQTPGGGACNVSTPQINAGTSFVPFNALTRLEVRSGRPNNADWQWGLGTNTQATGSFVQAYLNWVSGRLYTFTLSYNGQGAGTYTLSYNGTQLFSKTWNTGLQVGNALQFYAKTTAGIGAGNYITVNVTSIDGSPLNSSLQTAGDNAFDEAKLTYVIPSQPTGFTVSGTIAFTFVGSAPPTGSRLNFFITAGNVTCQSSQEALYFISPDHLNTPRTVADNTGNLAWSWAGEPFGSMPPNANPSGLGNFTFNLRFPGQYFDQETGLHYNYYRDYDPSTGRYVESDPIGLQGGINTYTYVNDDPLSGTDRLGLAKFCCRLLDDTLFGTVLRKRHCYIVADDGITYGLYPESGVGVPGTNYPKDRGGECFDCPPLHCNQNKCLKDAHDSYPRGDWSAPGPNSNTYAGTLARSCCKGGVPGGVHGAPGIDDPPPAPRPPIPRDQRL